MTPFGSALDEIRANRRPRWLALAAAVAVGLAAAQVHWYGFLVGGALVGLVSKTTARALLAGIAFGLLAVAVFSGLLASNGALWRAAAMGEAFYLGVAIPVVGAGLGSLVRGVV
ncbi:hypothetical protein NGM10_14640 [Halorussus salilacus]|uniref:hypothetical protein n=1 Tax=Halorussus salilacus TaxID=2953750 RepID=UPI00209CB9DC|nr:hypothetical protein [Halorussus salilacus]USZ67958.1 hypothetical protein NGM10_14640 [Halorussus salilacus]